jgi:DNA helicase HerA-like ATPase
MRKSTLGQAVYSCMQLVALSREDLLKKERIPFYLYVDEVHIFATASFADILSEARKYGLGLVMAHRSLVQLGDLRRAVLGNIGTLITFRLGQEEPGSSPGSSIRCLIV